MVKNLAIIKIRSDADAGQLKTSFMNRWRISIMSSSISSLLIWWIVLIWSDGYAWGFFWKNLSSISFYKLTNEQKLSRIWDLVVNYRFWSCDTNIWLHLLSYVWTSFFLFYVR